MFKYLKKEYIFLILFSLFCWWILLVYSHSVNSGYKLLDDKYFLFLNDRLTNSLSIQDFFTVMKKIIFPDSGFYSDRFLPGFWLNRIGQVLFFGTNHLYHSIYIGVLGFLTSCFLFLSVKNPVLQFLNQLYFL